MVKNIFKYAIFLTSWGWAGFVADQQGLRFLFLPEQRKEDVVLELRKNLNNNSISNINNIAFAILYSCPPLFFYFIV